MTREEAIKEVEACNWRTFGKRKEALDMAIAALKQQKPRWIPVEEQMPCAENIRSVDVWFATIDGDVYEGFAAYNVFYTEDIVVDQSKITHWMPREKPEAPAEN